MTDKHYRLVIIGSGPAGYTAAIYAARAALEPVLFTGIEVGGQMTTTTDVDNWPGDADGVQGPELMERMKRQAERFGTQLIYETVNAVDFSKRPFINIVESRRNPLLVRSALATAVPASNGVISERLTISKSKAWSP